MEERLKLAFVDREAEGIYVIGELHEGGRISRLMEFDRTPENGRIARRMVAAFNACMKLSDKSLQQLAEDRTSSGDLAERAVAWSLFMYVARPTALKILKRARDQIHKEGGTV